MRIFEDGLNYSDRNFLDQPIIKTQESGKSGLFPNSGTQSKPLPLIDFTNEFFDLIDEIKSPITKSIMELEKSPTVHNGLRIETVDVSDVDWHFKVIINDKERPMKIGQFIRYFFSGDFTPKEIFLFSKSYNRLRKGSGSQDPEDDSQLIDVSLYKKKFTPDDIKSTFISLVTETYPHGTEEEVMKYMPDGLTKDKFGNYYKIIGKSETMFTSHLDTALMQKSDVVLYSSKRNGDEFISTDGVSILGADDKAGVVIMLYMMMHNIPGVYYFFIGEERGGIGSSQVAMEYESFDHLKGMKRCISFDRRNYHSIITSQMGRDCCSDNFANALCSELNRNGMKMNLDPTGIYTDSANFVDEIGECTNISVGYFNEHTGNEFQNITFLENLCKACIGVDWESLPLTRKVGFTEYIINKYRRLIVDVKSNHFNCETKVMGEEGKAFIKIHFEDTDIDSAHEDFITLATLLNKHKFNPDVYFEDDFIKIELK